MTKPMAPKPKRYKIEGSGTVTMPPVHSRGGLGSLHTSARAENEANDNPAKQYVVIKIL